MFFGPAFIIISFQNKWMKLKRMSLTLKKWVWILTIFSLIEMNQCQSSFWQLVCKLGLHLLITFGLIFMIYDYGWYNAHDVIAISAIFIILAILTLACLVIVY